MIINIPAKTPPIIAPVGTDVVGDDTVYQVLNSFCWWIITSVTVEGTDEVELEEVIIAALGVISASMGT